MDGSDGRKVARGSQSQEGGLGSDWEMQGGSIEWESLGIADQHAAVNRCRGLVHRARRSPGVDCTGNRWANRKEAAAYGMVGDWWEVVAR